MINCDMVRRPFGEETWRRLREWGGDQKASERLAAHILAFERFEDIDPQHPRGGPDGGKDIICYKNGKKWIVGVYFARDPRSFPETRSKFQHDAKEAIANEVQGFVFVTNQTLTLAERDELKELAFTEEIEIYHLDRMARILDTPGMYWARFDFLQIRMTEEEKLDSLTSVIRHSEPELSKLKLEIVRSVAVAASNINLAAGEKWCAEYVSLLQQILSFAEEAHPYAEAEADRACSSHAPTTKTFCANSGYETRNQGAA